MPKVLLKDNNVRVNVTNTDLNAGDASVSDKPDESAAEDEMDWFGLPEDPTDEDLRTND